MEKLARQIEFNNDSFDRFLKLRQRTLAIMREEIKNRLESNPKPTEEEILIGAFKEQIEPQVRSAVFELNNKGYKTTSSGFHRGNAQAIEGFFMIDDDSKKKIEELGARVLRGPDIGAPENKNITQIRFYPKEANLRKIKAKWDAIVKILPEMKIGEPSGSKSEKFKYRYCQDQPGINQKINDYFDGLKRPIAQ